MKNGKMVLDKLMGDPEIQTVVEKMVWDHLKVLDSASVDRISKALADEALSDEYDKVAHYLYWTVTTMMYLRVFNEGIRELG